MDKIVYLGGYMSEIVTPKIAASVVARDVAVIGSGYVGLTLSASLALLGHQVECTDNSPERVAQLAEGHVPITESGLTELVEEMLAAGRLRFGTDNAQAAARAEFIFLCLPTPNGADGSADLSSRSSTALRRRSALTFAPGRR
jgi:UDPglucose 6-dehydrogenase